MMSADSSEDDGLLLTYRVQVVKNNGDRSHHKHVVHGFPQVTDLGPKVHSLIGNDKRPRLLYRSGLLYGDDTKTLVVRGGDPVEAEFHAEHPFGLGKAFGFRPIS